DLLAAFRPRRHRTVTVRASPAALGPHQHRRAPRDRQVAHCGAGPAMSDRPRAALGAADHLRGGLHVQPPLAVDQLVRADDEPGHANERGCALATVHHGQGSLLLQMSQSAESRGPWPRWWTL